MDAKWYANWIRLLPASTAEENMRNLEAADKHALLAVMGVRVPEEEG